MPARLRELGWSVEAHDDHFAPTAKDVELFPAVAEHGWVLLTQDARIRYHHAEKAALLAAGLRTFVLVTGNLTSAETVAVLERARRAIETLVGDQAPPFICIIGKNGSLRLAVRVSVRRLSAPRACGKLCP